jgi:hypothetical protein
MTFSSEASKEFLKDTLRGTSLSRWPNLTLIAWVDWEIDVRNSQDATHAWLNLPQVFSSWWSWKSLSSLSFLLWSRSLMWSSKSRKHDRDNESLLSYSPILFAITSSSRVSSSSISLHATSYLFASWSDSWTRLFYVHSHFILYSYLTWYTTSLSMSDKTNWHCTILLIETTGAGWHRVEVCPNKAVDVILRRRRNSSHSLQHNTNSQVFCLLVSLVLQEVLFSN